MKISDVKIGEFFESFSGVKFQKIKTRLAGKEKTVIKRIDSGQIFEEKEFGEMILFKVK